MSKVMKRENSVDHCHTSDRKGWEEDDKRWCRPGETQDVWLKAKGTSGLGQYGLHVTVIGSFCTVFKKHTVKMKCGTAIYCSRKKLVQKKGRRVEGGLVKTLAQIYILNP